MLTAVLPDGTAVNIVKRGADIVRDGTHFVTVVSDTGTVYPIYFVQEIEPTGVNAALAVADGVLSAQHVDAPLAGDLIYAFSSLSGDSSCPEVIEWLMQNYGLTFSPVGLHLFASSSYMDGYIQSFACKETQGVSALCMFVRTFGDVALGLPAGTIETVLGCDGSAVSRPNELAACNCAALECIRSFEDNDYLYSFNAWLFYLSSGLPREIFEE